MFNPVVHNSAQVLAAAWATTAEVKDFAFEPVGVKDLMYKTMFIGQMQDLFCFFQSNFVCYSSFYEVVGEFVESEACSEGFIAVLVGDSAFTVTK